MDVGGFFVVVMIVVIPQYPLGIGSRTPVSYQNTRILKFLVYSSAEFAYDMFIFHGL